MEKKCEVCKVTYDTSYNRAKVCSDICRKQRFNKITGRYSNTDLSSGTVGAISEMMVGVDLMKKGYAVFRALSPSCLCDLVAYKNNRSFLVEVRTGYIQESGKVFFVKNLKDKGRQDIYGIYVRAEDKVFYFTPNSQPTDML